MARLVVLALLLVLGTASAGSLRGAINKTQGAAAPAMAAPTTPGRGLTGSLENRQESVRATMPPVHPSRVEQVGTPPLVTLQGQALGPAELPVLLPFASPSVSTP